MQSNAMAPAAVDETDRLIRSDKIGGAAVFKDAGDSLGSINAVMIDKRSGQIKYLIIRFTHPSMMTRYGWGAVRAQA